MARRKSRERGPSALAVHLHGRRVGVITRLVGDKSIFAFEEEYVEDAGRPVLSLAFQEPSGGLKTDIRPVSTRLLPFFSNLLPEGRLREYLAARAGVKPEREFFLLHGLGADLPGAVRIAAMDADGEPGDDGLGDDGRADDDRNAGMLRFSLAGMQLKFSAIVAARGGLTIPARGVGGHWIVKLPSAGFAAVPENEFVMMELARRVGIPVPRARLVDVQDIDGLPEDVGEMAGKALAVERFDRQADGTRVHIEDFAQVFGVYPEDKYNRHSYANIASVLWAVAGPEAVDDFMARLVFSVLIGNADMHLKNWSLIYRDARTPALAPAYDMVATLPYLPNGSLALSLGGSKDIGAVVPEQIRRFADRGRLAANPLWRIVEETVERTLAGWRVHDVKEMLPDKMRAGLQRHIEKVARKSTGKFD